MINFNRSKVIGGPSGGNVVFLNGNHLSLLEFSAKQLRASVELPSRFNFVTVAAKCLQILEIVATTFG